jgi:type II secretory pathway predicted ATPase ExeA
MGVSAPTNHLESQLVQAAFKHAQDQKNLYILIDEAHLLDVTVLRKLRLLFERFPKLHNWVLLGHPELLTRISLMCNEDIKSHISYSKTILPLSPIDLRKFIETECTSVGLTNNSCISG